MSKFKKYDKFDLFSLEDFFEDYLKEYELHESETSATDPYASLDIAEESDFYDALMEIYVQDLEVLTRNITPSPNHVISGSGPAWFYEPLMKTFVKAERGSQVVIVPGNEDERGRLLVRASSTSGYLMIPYEEILDIGYN
jgi:hypothetical protein